MAENKINLNFDFIRRFENPQESVEPYVKRGQVAADLGCNKGFYTLALAKCVGPEGKVYAVDLKEDFIREIEIRAREEGYGNIEFHASSAADLNFIKDESVDFVLANGLLCNMPEHRQLAIKEIKRILKPTGRAYLSLGTYAPLTFVSRAEWKKILEGFRVERSDGFIQPWALVSKREEGGQLSGENTGTAEPSKFLKFRKRIGE